MDISVVLATYKRQEILQKTLESFSKLNSTSLEWELWVVDNAGEPATEKVVQAWADKLPVKYLVVLEAGKNNALNRALPEVAGQLVVLTDDDIIATPGWLKKIWQGAQRWPHHVVFGGRVLPHWPEGFDPPDINEPFMANAYAIADWDLPEGEYEPKKVFGPNMAVRREIFDEGWRFDGDVGPSQDVNYIMGSETDFILRLQNQGYQPVYLPDALVYHQIRPEQMHFKWIKKRAYRAGRGEVHKSEDRNSKREIFGYPPYLIRRLFDLSLSYAMANLFKRRKRKRVGIQFYFLLGKLSKY